jgi:hypothetical protein
MCVCVCVCVYTYIYRCSFHEPSRRRRMESHPCAERASNCRNIPSPRVTRGGRNRLFVSEPFDVLLTTCIYYTYICTGRCMCVCVWNIYIYIYIYIYTSVALEARSMSPAVGFTTAPVCVSNTLATH